MKRPELVMVLAEYRVDEQMGGIGVRAIGLAAALGQFASVTIICARECDLPSPPCCVVDIESVDHEKLIRSANIVMFFDLGSPELLRIAVETDSYIVVENAVPLEHLEYNSSLSDLERSKAYLGYVQGFRAQVAVADYFIARSEIERRLLISALTLEGRILPQDIKTSRTLEHLITVVPIGILSHELAYSSPEHKQTGFYAWSGGLWDYMAYDIAIEAFHLSDRFRHLQFLYLPPNDQRLRAEGVFDQNKLDPNRVSIVRDTILHSKRGGFINRASALICLGREGIENETCIRLRVRDCLLYRRPLIVDGNGATGEYVQSTGIGLVLPELSPNALLETLDKFETCNSIRVNCLEAIETERGNCVIEQNLGGLKNEGNRVNWRSGRSVEERLRRLEYVLDANRSGLRTPFQT